MQVETVTEAFFEVPEGVNDGVDWRDDIVAHGRNAEREFADPGELGE
jgi:hypothetical protein